MDNFQNNCCRPWTKKLFTEELVFKEFKNRKRTGGVDRQQVRSIDRNLFFFKLKLLIFRRWWQLWMKWTTIKQRYRMNLFFVVFRLFVLPQNSMSKFIQNRCTCRLIIKTGYTRVCKRTIGSVFLCFSPLFCSPLCSALKIMLKQLLASGLVNIGENSPRVRLGEYSLMFTELRWIIVNYSHKY